MKGDCGKEFKPYNASCENCRYYDYCMKAFNDYMEKENAPGDNFPKIPLQPYEEEIKKNQEKFKKLKPITTEDVDMFKVLLDRMSGDAVIKTIELYREER